jgi:hypothetical protein
MADDNRKRSKLTQDGFATDLFAFVALYGIIYQPHVRDVAL